MASIDKIYGNKEEAKELYGWLESHKEDLKETIDVDYRKLCHFSKNDIENNFSAWKNTDDIVLMNNPFVVDFYLINNCELPFIVERLKVQYGSDFYKIKDKYFRIGKIFLKEKRIKPRYKFLTDIPYYGTGRGVVRMSCDFRKGWELYYYNQNLDLWDYENLVNCDDSEKIIENQSTYRTAKKELKEMNIVGGTVITFDNDFVKNDLRVLIKNDNILDVGKFNSFMKSFYKKSYFKDILNNYKINNKISTRQFNYYLFKFLKKYNPEMIRDFKKENQK